MLIDVRTEEEFTQAHHETAVHIPLDTMQQADLPCGKDEHIILHCRSGARAQAAKEILESRGYTNVTLKDGTGAY
ncbi:MAG: hypothetical protein RIQ41_336 [Candidatus Parcubacteria bacterium]|jgi:phage shock protein E